MTLSLNPKTNPLVRLYELFEVPGVRTDDGPSYLKLTVPLIWAKTGSAYELVRFLSELPPAMLSSSQLRFEGNQFADFTPQSALDWFDWDIIEELSVAGQLCEACAEIFQALRSRQEEFAVGGSWENMEDDCLLMLTELETCPDCGPRFAIDVALDKALAIERFLTSAALNSEKTLSTLIWSDSAHMANAFENFQEFLVFMAEKVESPLVLFFYRPTDVYQGKYFKILPLTRTGSDTSGTERKLAQELTDYTTDVFNDYQMLRTDHKDEKRTDLGERFNIPPTLFLRQNKDLASYPSHPVFMSGPVRSLLVYSAMAWLALQTDEDGDATVFKLATDKSSPVKISLNFSLTGVCHKDASIFSGDKWSEITGRLARDIEQSAGSEFFRECWEQALQGLKPSDFTADKFFETLEAIRLKAEERRKEPQESIKELTPDLALYVHVDAVNKKLVFQLGYLNPTLGLGFKRFDAVELNLEDNQDLLRELDESAKRNLTAMLGDAPGNPAVKIPRMENLETRGEGLWDDIIPDELKRAYVKLREHEDLSLFIFSEDRSFPWELIKPRELVGSEIHETGFSDDWWALRFGLARWAAGAPPPANTISITKVCCVAASSALSSAEEEVKYFESLEAQGITLHQPKTRGDLLEYLKTTDYDLIHFACHGEFKTSDPGESAIQLPDGSLLHPDDLRANNIPQKIRNNRPLIFLNCCHSGRTGSTLVGIAGWAKRLVDWGCGAFLGCGWEVADPLAAEFALNFYKNFRDEHKTLGQAVHHARRQIKDRSMREGVRENSTWLAYFLYGNPNCAYGD